MERIFEYTSYVGGALLLIAFLLNSTKKIEPDSYTYLILNTIGGYANATYAFTDFQKLYPFAIINTLWGTGGLFGTIYKKFHKK
jgi:hypothetical protein